MHICCIIGAPGSGKGTNSIKLCEEHANISHISIGHELRAMQLEKGSGTLASIDTISQVLDACLAKKEYVILDGFPRNVEQLRLLRSREVDLAIAHILVNDQDELIRNLSKRYSCHKCSRSCLESMYCDFCDIPMYKRIDDLDPEAILKRIAIYQSSLTDIYKYAQSNYIPIVEIAGYSDTTYQEFKERVLSFFGIDNLHF